MHKSITCSLIALALSACGKAPAPAPEGSAVFRPTASIQELMASIVDPSADALWDAVSSETTSKGVEEHQPHTEQEWQAARHYAIALQEAGNLLQMPGRAVTHAGKKTEDAHVEGVSSAQQVQTAIAQARPGFNAAARVLQDAAGEALAAIDKKDPAALIVAGGKLDQACESCHSVYWYPNAKLPSTKAWPAPLQPTK